jgi:hypothetical protein
VATKDKRKVTMQLRVDGPTMTIEGRKVDTRLGKRAIAALRRYALDQIRAGRDTRWHGWLSTGAVMRELGLGFGYDARDAGYLPTIAVLKHAVSLGLLEERHPYGGRGPLEFRYVGPETTRLIERQAAAAAERAEQAKASARRLGVARWVEIKDGKVSIPLDRFVRIVR